MMSYNKSDKIIINRLNMTLVDFDKKKCNINLNRVAFIFVIIFFFVVLYSTRVIYLSSKTLHKNLYQISKINRADIVDRNGDYISKSVYTSNLGIDPKLIKDKKKLLLKLQYTFPNKDLTEIKRKFTDKNSFMLKKKIIPEEYQQLKLLGEKSIRLEKKLQEYIQIKIFFHM